MRYVRDDENLRLVYRLTDTEVKAILTYRDAQKSYRGLCKEWLGDTFCGAAGFFHKRFLQPPTNCNYNDVALYIYGQRIDDATVPTEWLRANPNGGSYFYPPLLVERQKQH